MNEGTPEGVTPPTPRLDKEEPDLWQEDDIPTDEDPQLQDVAPGRDD